MTQLAQKYYSLEEYLALEEKAKCKSEYYGGQIYQMAGGSANHSRISLNVSLELTLALRGKGCEVFNSDMKIAVKANSLHTYADASVMCGEVEFAPGRDDIIANPLLLVEVLSPSTRNYDRADKFLLYRALASFQTYLIIEQSRVYLECYQKQPDGSWELRTYTDASQSLKLESLQLEIPIAALYQRVKFPLKVPRLPRERKIPHPTPE
jgi:Uma2 family endonuclease